MKLKTLFIFILGFIAGCAATVYLTQYIEQEVASRIDDKRVLQQAGFIPPFEVDSLEPAKWGN